MRLAPRTFDLVKRSVGVALIVGPIGAALLTGFLYLESVLAEVQAVRAELTAAAQAEKERDEAWLADDKTNDAKQARQLTDAMTELARQTVTLTEIKKLVHELEAGQITVREELSHLRYETGYHLGRHDQHIEE